MHEPTCLNILAPPVHRREPIRRGEVHDAFAMIRIGWRQYHDECFNMAFEELRKRGLERGVVHFNRIKLDSQFLCGAFYLADQDADGRVIEDSDARSLG